MALFAVTLSDETTDVVEGADAYQQEGPMTTFFAFQSNRRVIDSWSLRLASYRTADIAAIRRSADANDQSGRTCGQGPGLEQTDASTLLAIA